MKSAVLTLVLALTLACEPRAPVAGPSVAAGPTASPTARSASTAGPAITPGLPATLPSPFASVPPIFPQAKVITDFGDWQVTTISINNKQAAGISLNPASAKVVTSYVTHVRGQRALFQSYPEIPVTIILRRPIPIPRFTELMQKSGLKVKSLELRTVQPDGMKGGMSVPAGPDGSIDQRRLEGYLSSGESRGRGTLTVEGVVHADAIISLATYDALIRETNDVYLIDIGRAVAHAELVKNGIRDIPLAEITLPPVAMGLEMNNLPGG